MASALSTVSTVHISVTFEARGKDSQLNSAVAMKAFGVLDSTSQKLCLAQHVEPACVELKCAAVVIIGLNDANHPDRNQNIAQRINGHLNATNSDVRPPDLVLITSSVHTFSAQDEDDAQTAFGDDVRELETKGWEVLKDSLSAAPGTGGAGAGKPVGSTSTPAAATCTGSTGSIPGYDKSLLLEACQAVRLPMGRLRSIQQHTPSTDALHDFSSKGFELAMAALARGSMTFMNPAGHSWVILAVPGSDAAEQSRNTVRILRGEFSMYDAADTLAQSADQRTKVYLASDQYHGAGILTRALLGSGQSPYDLPSDSAPGSSTVTAESDFIALPPPPRESCLLMCLGVFKSKHQLLPVFSVCIDAWGASAPGSAAQQGDSLEDMEGQGQCLLLAPARNSSDAHRTTLKDQIIIWNLKKRVRELEVNRKVKRRENALLKEKIRSAHRRRKTNDENIVQGCHRVTLEAEQPRLCGMETISLDEKGPGPERPSEAKKRKCARGAVGIETIFVKMQGGKGSRRDPGSKSKPGGLAWRDGVMACAVMTFSLFRVSYKTGGAMCFSWLRAIQREVYIKAEALGNCKSRRIKPESLHHIFPNISPRSMRRGVHSMNLAKNSCLIDALNEAHAIAFSGDLTSVAEWTVQGIHIRTFRVVWNGKVDAAETKIMEVDCLSWVVDVFAVGDKLVQKRRFQEADGTWKELPIEVPTCFATQLMYCGAYHALMRCRGLSATFDGGNESVGAGNRTRARETMCGENSILELLCMFKTAGDAAFKILNDELGLFVPLSDMYGFDWENGDFLNRKPVDKRVNTVEQLLREAKGNVDKIMDSSKSSAPSSALVDLTSDSEVASKIEILILDLTRDSDDDDPDQQRPTPASAVVDSSIRAAAPRPIYDTLSSFQDAQPIPFYDFVVRDMANAYEFLQLPQKVEELTESTVEDVEEFIKTLIGSTEVVDADRFTKIITEESWNALPPNNFMHDDAVNFMLGPMTHAMGGRLLTGSGRCTTGPRSPLIEVDVSQNFCVIDSIITSYLETKVNEANSSENQQQAAEQAIKHLTRVFRAKDGRQRNVSSTVGEMVEIGPDTVVIAATHLPGHFVTTEVEHLGQSEKNVAITRTDSFCAMNSMDHFQGEAHNALRVAFRAMKLIGEKQKVDCFGVALQRQDRPDCAFYMLTRLAARLTGKHLRSDLLGLFTRLLRCYTGFLLYRSLHHDNAIRDVWNTAFSLWKQQRLEAHHTENIGSPAASGPLIEAGAFCPMPQPTMLATKDAEDAMWLCAIEGREEYLEKDKAERRKITDKLNDLLLDFQLKKAAERARAAWKPEARAMPKQLSTEAPVCVCNTLPIRCNHANPDLEGKWKGMYEQPLDRISMRQNPCRYFIMAEEDGANSNLKAGWCGRHRIHWFSEQAAARKDCFPSICEEVINFARNSFFHRRAVRHAAGYVGIEGNGRNRVRADKINTAVSKAMQGQIDSWGPLTGKMNIMTDGSTAPPSYHDVVRTEILKRGSLRKPRVCAATRWGTRYGGQAWAHLYGSCYAALTIHIYGQASEQQLANQAASVFSKHGHKDEKRTRFPPRVGRHLYFLTSQKDKLYCAIGRVTNILFVQPLLAAFSRDNECACPSVCGLGSFIRKLLRFLRSELFVGKFNIADSITGSNQAADFRAAHPKQYKNQTSTFEGTSNLFDARRKRDPKSNSPEKMVKLAHRDVGSLKGAYRRGFFLINPRADARKFFGPFCSEDMVSCVTELLGTMRRIAEMEGEIELYPTLEKLWKDVMGTRPGHAPESNWSQVVAKGNDCPKEESNKEKARFVRNMHKMQWAFGQLVMDMEAALLKWFDHELFSLMGFVGCTTMRRSVKVLNTATNKIEDVMIAHEDAVACGVIASRMIDELVARYPGEDVPRFLPSQLTDLLSDPVRMKEFREFCLGHAIEGFHLVDAEGNVRKDKRGDAIVAGPAPAERYPIYAFQAFVIRLFQTASNDIERVFNPVADGFRRGGRNVCPLTISVWCRRNDWVSAGLWGKEKDPVFLKVYALARRFFRTFEPRVRNLFLPDTYTSEQRKMCARLDELPVRNRNGQAFPTSNIVPNKKAFRFGPARENDDGGGEDPSVQKPHAKKRATLGAVLVKKAREVRAKKGAPGLKKRAPLKRAPICKRRRCAGVEDKPASVPAGEGTQGDEHYSGDQGGDLEDAAEEATESDAMPNVNLVFQKAAKLDSDVDPAKTGKRSVDGYSAAHRQESEEGTEGDMGEGASSSRTVLADQGAQKGKLSAAATASVSRSTRNTAANKNSAAAQPLEESAEGGGRVDDSSAGGANSGEDWVHPMLKEIQEWSASNTPLQPSPEWTPSTVGVPPANPKSLVLTRCDGIKVSVPRGQESGCTAYLFYDLLTAEVYPVLIKTLYLQSGEWKINYCRLYTTTEAIRIADRDEDTDITKTLPSGDTVNQCLRGRKFLKTVLLCSNRLHHAGDFLVKGSHVSNIVGVMAWTPAAVLTTTKEVKKEDTERLRADLVKLGLTKEMAIKLSKDPLYIGDHFSESKPTADSSGDDESEESDSPENKETGPSDQLLMNTPSRRSARVHRNQVLGQVQFSKEPVSSSSSESSDTRCSR